MVCQLPRILILHATKLQADDPANLLIRQQFGRWPAQRLAQVFSGQTAGSGTFCGRYYQLGPQDRFAGRLFMRLRGPVASAVAMDTPAPAPAIAIAPAIAPPTAPAAPPVGALHRLVHRSAHAAASALIQSGLAELLFHVRLSRPLDAFIRDFRPQMIYCTGYHFGFTVLPLLIAHRFDLPVCFQTFEDWPQYSLRGSLIGPLVRLRARELICAAHVRMALGPAMQRAFQRRYGVRFHTTWHLDDPARFAALPQPPGDPARPRRIVFTGSLVLSRHEAIADLLRAIRTLDMPNLRIDVYCPGIPPDLPEPLRAAPELQFLPLPAHADLPRVLVGADVLFLPESFAVAADRLSLALSTKCHLYMLAGRPILAYGPPYAGTMRYARQAGWAMTITRRDVAALADAVRRLLTDPCAAHAMRARAAECVSRHHDLRSGQARFESLIRAAAGPEEWGDGT